eukprot:5971707-Prymnesium_polylepis.3
MAWAAGRMHMCMCMHMSMHMHMCMHMCVMRVRRPAYQSVCRRQTVSSGPVCSHLKCARDVRERADAATLHTPLLLRGARCADGPHAMAAHLCAHRDPRHAHASWRQAFDPKRIHDAKVWSEATRTHGG